MDKEQRIKRLRLINKIRLVYSCFMGLVIIAGFGVSVLFCMGIRPFIVVSGSMEPAIHVGSICAVNMNCPYNEIADNDIISFKNGEMTVTHRAVKVTQNGIVTKGDANNTDDVKPVTMDDYIGKVIFSIPYLGYGAAVFKTRLGIFMGVGFVILSLLIDSMLDMLKDIAVESSTDKGDVNEKEE